MASFEYFKYDSDPLTGGVKPDAEEPLEFHIYGDPKRSPTPSDAPPTEGKNDLDNEFTIPESLIADELGDSQSVFEPPAGMRPTYFPRFTEVSENYRMRNDPRPRPRTDTHDVKATKDDDVALDLDPTTERLEEREVERIVVRPAVIHNSEPTDEKLTVLKFSTPTYPEEEKLEPVIIPTPVEVEEEPEELVEFVVEPPLVDEEPVNEEPRIIDPESVTIPDPERGYQVIDFTPREVHVIEEPKGSTDSDKKGKSPVRGEFDHVAQRDSIKDRFLDTLMAIRVRLVGSVLLLLVLAMMDCLPYFGIDVLSMLGFGAFPYTKAVIDIQFAVCAFLFALPEVIRAFGMLGKKNIAPELFLVISLVFVVINDVIVIKFGAISYVTFGVLYALQCLVAVIATYHRTLSDFTAFKIVSRNVTKNVLDKRLTRELQRENFALDGKIDEYSSKTARMFRTAFVSNFFKKTATPCENSGNVAMMMGVGFGLSAVSGVFAFILSGNSFVSGAQSATLVLLLALPTFSLLVHKLPYKHACRNAAAEESAFVGESSLYDGADVDVFTYDDTEIFGHDDVKLRKVHLYGKVYNTPKAMQQMYALFSEVGGPLDFVFSASLDRKCASATDIIIEDNGISGMLDGHRICAGTEEYMINHGISIPGEDRGATGTSSASTKIMYGAEDGEIYVKFFIMYSFSEEFTVLLPELREKKIVPLVYTRDPNVTNELFKSLTLGVDVIRVVRKYVPRPDEDKTYRRIDSGMVTHGDKASAVNMVLLAKKYATFQSSLAATELISMIVGAALAVVLAIGDMIVLPATMLSLWQVVWCVVLALRSRLFFRNPIDREEELEEQ